MPGPSCYERRVDELTQGEVVAEALTEVYSVEDGQDEDTEEVLVRKKGASQGVGWKRRKIEVREPSTPEDLRRVHGLMARCWIMAKLRHPAKPALNGMSEKV